MAEPQRSVLIWAALAIITGLLIAILSSSPIGLTPVASSAIGDHVATNGEINTTVQVRENLSNDGDAVAGLSWSHNNTIQIDSENNMAWVYLHELGHQMGYGHEDNTIMHPHVKNDARCGLGEAERDIAESWNTTKIKSVGDCEYIETPYGPVY